MSAGKSGVGKSGTGKTRVKTARRRTAQSTRWLQRQLDDPYVKAAKAHGYRSRAAYKLLELDEKFGLLKGTRRIVDLAPPPAAGFRSYGKSARRLRLSALIFLTWTRLTARNFWSWIFSTTRPLTR